MVEIILSVATLIFALIGLTSIIRFITLLFVVPRKNGKQAYVVLLNDKNAEFDLRAAIERAKWDNVFNLAPILAVEYELDDETSKICKKISEEYTNVIMCRSQDLLQNLI